MSVGPYGINVEQNLKKIFIVNKSDSRTTDYKAMHLL